MKTPVIKINNKTEKLAALAYLSVISGLTIRPLVFSQTVNKDETVFNFPYVYVDIDDVISARSDIHENKDYVEIPFSKLYDFTSYDELVKYVNKDEKTLKLEFNSKVKLTNAGCIYTIVNTVSGYTYLYNDTVQNFPLGNSLKELAANTLDCYPDAKVVD